MGTHETYWFHYVIEDKRYFFISVCNTSVQLPENNNYYEWDLCNTEVTDPLGLSICITFKSQRNFAVFWVLVSAHETELKTGIVNW